MNNYELRPISVSDFPDGVRSSLGSIEIEQPWLHPMLPQDNYHTEGSSMSRSSSLSIQPLNDAPAQRTDSAPVQAYPSRDTRIADEGETDTLKGSVQKQNLHRPIFFDWWEEIASIVLSFVCTALALTVLFYMDGDSMTNWKLPVQPNTVVAFLATLTRAALIFPLAECLGQLKWTFFERPRSLDFMNTFDVATRGPLGAFNFLWLTKIQSPLSSSAAVIIVLLLVFQPFMQQTIVFATRSAPMSNETAFATHATSWVEDSFSCKLSKEHHCTADNSGLWPELMNPADVPSLSYQLFKTVTSDESSDPFKTHCSTSRCDYPPFDALSVCTVCEDHVINGNVLGSSNNCTFTINATGREIFQPSLQDIRLEIEGLRWDKEFYANLTCTQDPFPFSMVFENTLQVGYPNTRLWFYPFGDLEYQPRTYTDWFQNITDTSWGGQSSLTLERKNLKVCKYLTADIYRFPHYETYNYILDSMCFNKTTDLWRYFYEGEITPHFGEVNGTLTTCSLKPCGKSYDHGKVKDNIMSIDMGKSTLKFKNATSQPDIDWRWRSESSDDDWIYAQFMYQTVRYCTEDSTECPYAWKSLSFHNLGRRLHNTLTSPEFSDSLSSSSANFNHNFTVLFERIAREASNWIQSSANPNATNITGIAYGSELYVQVRWPWLILPLLTIVASTIILGLTVFESRKRSYLFKNKILAAIAFELEGWSRQDYGTDGVWERESMNKLEGNSKRMMTRMQLPNGVDEGLKLKKE